MRNILTIALKEYKSYFTSPIGYVVMAAWILFAGVIFYLMLSSPSPVADMEPLFRNITIFMVMFLPLLTMRLLAGERGGDQGTGTIEVLLTSPITEWQLTLGKYLATMLYALTLVAVSLIYAIALKVLGKPAGTGAVNLGPDMGKIAGGYVGFLLFSGYVLALGLFLSSMTSSQIVAAITTIVGALVLWLVSFLKESPSGFMKFVAWFSMLSHHEDFWSGMVSLPEVLWFLSFIFFFLFATQQVLASSRWR